MKYQISSISILQASKILAILYTALGLILVPFSCIFIFLGVEEPEFLLVGIFYLFSPIIYGVIGFIFTAIGVWLYNLVAGRWGGFEIELTPTSESTTLSAQS